MSACQSCMYVVKDVGEICQFAASVHRTGWKREKCQNETKRIRVLAKNEYHNHQYSQIMTRQDRRKRAKERVLTAPYGVSNNLGDVKSHGQFHQVQFKITPFAEKVGSEAAALFGMSLSQYCKALLYLNLGLVFEPVDRRRKERPFKK